MVVNDVSGKRTLARKLQEEDERMSKNAKTGDDNGATTTSAAGASSSSSKRWAHAEEYDDRSSSTKRHSGLQSSRDEKRKLEHQDGNESGDEDVDVANLEGNRLQDHTKWTINNVRAIKTSMDDNAYFDENAWERSDQDLVEKGEKAGLARFKKMGGY